MTMKSKLAATLLILIALTTLVLAQGTFDPNNKAPNISLSNGNNTATEGGPVIFTALHTYYVSKTGSDANNCTTVAQACKTMGASGLSGVVCGDAILVNSGSYTAGEFNQNFPTPSNCPSTSDGIDGMGGIYFVALVCAGADVMSCINDTTSSGGTAFWVNRSNWAIEGFWAKTPPDGSNCFIGNNFNTGGGVIHHVAFINNIVTQCGDSGFSTSGGGGPLASVDQTAVVGAVAFNAANSQTNGAECGSAISIIPSNGPDTSAGTHVYIAGFYLGYNTNTGAPGSPGCNVAGGHSDGEGIIFDTWGAGYTPSGYLYQAAVEQGLIWHSGGSSVQIFPQAAAGANDRSQYFISDTTMYAGDQDTSGNGICRADLHLHDISPNVSPTTTSVYDIRNVIVLATVQTCGNLGGNPSYAMNINPEFSAVLNTAPITVTGNYIFNSANGSGGYNTTNSNVFYTDTRSTNSCGSGTTRCNNFPFGTNTYSDPGLGGISSLWSTAPDCTGYTNVTTCMLTKYTVDVFAAPTIAPTSMGYQKPSGCSTKVLANGTNAFPAWLKGVVYLTASGFTNGATITMNPGLVTKPCGL